MKNGKLVSLPLAGGTGKSPIGDFVSFLPVNLLQVPAGAAIESSFLRSFPGLVKESDVDGVSRGALYSVANGYTYRVCGNKLYQNGVAVMEVPDRDRVTIAASDTAVAVAAAGKMLFFKRDGTTTELKNWAPSQYYPGSTTLLESGSKSGTGYNGSLTVVESMTDEGILQLTITPQTTTGAVGEVLVLSDGDYEQEFSQDTPASGTPYLTDVIIKGFKFAGETLTLSYTFNANGADGDDDTSFQWAQIVSPTDVENTQYDLGTVSDLCHANGRFCWVLKGTNEFGVTSTETNTDTEKDGTNKPDRYRPFITASAMPDIAIGIAAMRDMVVLFGTASTEFFTLTGSSSSSTSIYKSQSGLMIPIGIAGVHCKALVTDNRGQQQFAVLSNPATGQPSIYLLGSGRFTEIASRAIVQLISTVSADDLEKGVLEFVRYDIHQLLMVRVGSLSLCYDLTSKEWSQLCGTSLQQQHRAIDYVYDGTNITAGDTCSAITGKLDRTTAGQYGDRQEHIAYTPMFSVGPAKLFDLQLQSATGNADAIEHLAFSASTDGITWPAEMLIFSDAPQRYDIRPILNRVGYVKRNIAFRFRSLTKTPITLATCQVRIVNG
jgi:hypothetical protein